MIYYHILTNIYILKICAVKISPFRHIPQGCVTGTDDPSASEDWNGTVATMTAPVITGDVEVPSDDQGGQSDDFSIYVKQLNRYE